MNEAYALIKKAGLKMTPRRREMVALFLNSPAPLSPQEVQDQLKRLFSRCGLPGVYRNLETLADCGVLFRVVGFGRERSYALCCTPFRESTITIILFAPHVERLVRLSSATIMRG